MGKLIITYFALATLMHLSSTAPPEPISKLKHSVQNFDNTVKKQDHFNPNGNLMDKVENVIDENGDKPADDDMMETAETMVFRPLFRYKQQKVTQNKVYRENNAPTITQKPNNNGQNYHKNPPKYLVYDPKTRGYYPTNN